MTKQRLWILIFLTLLFLLGAALTRVREVSKNPLPQIHIVEEADAKVADPLREWIDRLADYECKNCPPLFRILDVNKRYSYSCLQFQERTFVEKTKEHNLLPHAEDHEIMNLIYDCPFQKELAYRMIRADYGEWEHWRTSTNRGLGLPPK